MDETKSTALDRVEATSTDEKGFDPYRNYVPSNEAQAADRFATDETIKPGFTKSVGQIHATYEHLDAIMRPTVYMLLISHITPKGIVHFTLMAQVSMMLPMNALVKCLCNPWLVQPPDFLSLPTMYLSILRIQAL